MIILWHKSVKAFIKEVIISISCVSQNVKDLSMIGITDFRRYPVLCTIYKLNKRKMSSNRKHKIATVSVKPYHKHEEYIIIHVDSFASLSHNTLIIHHMN